MHPAFSVIFFTTASGAGYGLLALLGPAHLLSLTPANSVFLLTAIGIALVLVCGGLLSSTFHLGHPERAWRALSQWRSSWLSREGVLAIASFLPILGFAISLGENTVVMMALALGMALSCLLTIYCTAMIYASLKTIHAWCNYWVVPAYLSLALMSGILLLNALVSLSAGDTKILALLTLLLIATAFGIKMAYWNYLTTSQPVSNSNTATGLEGKIKLVQSPHSQANYLMKEMGYKLARKHAKKLRGLCLVFAFVLPFLFTLLASIVASSVITTIFAILAVISATPGVLIERWLFFAEARHSVMLYYEDDESQLA